MISFAAIGNKHLDVRLAYGGRVEEAAWFQRINNAGWQDLWRERNPDGREYSWYSNRGGGFRLDQVFAPNHFADAVSNVRYDWGNGGRESKLSDHAAIVFDVAEGS